jgi:ankyrin repeat protein
MRATRLWAVILAAVLIAGGCREKARFVTTKLHHAAAQGDLAEVQRLIAHGANLNARDNIGRTPLHEAAGEGRREVVAFLVRCGAPMDCEDKYGLTPAMLAMHRGHRAVVESLVQAGATVDLYLAAYLGDVGRAEALIQGGADVLRFSE